MGNPQVARNLLILQIFVLATSILASVVLAVFMTRGITGPLDMLQGAMKRVEQSDFDVRVSVTSNDELGYLSERLNEMVAGLTGGVFRREAAAGGAPGQVGGSSSGYAECCAGGGA